MLTRSKIFFAIIGVFLLSNLVVVPASAEMDSEELVFLRIINDARAQNSLGELKISAALDSSAEWMSQDRATNKYSGHIDSLGRTAVQRMAAFGYVCKTFCGENVTGGSTAQRAYDSWYNLCDPNSAGTCTYAHRKNMLNPNFKVMGIARAQGDNDRWYWTADFGSVVDELLPIPESNEPHSSGRLILSQGTVWRINDDGKGRSGIDSAAKFYSHRFKFSSVAAANAADLNLPDTGLLPWGDGVLFLERGTVYQASGQQKRGFTSAEVFLGLGFRFTNIVPSDLTQLPEGTTISTAEAAHLPGTFVLDNAGTVWQILANGRKGMPDQQTFFATGARFLDVVPANSFDLALPAL